MLFTCSTAAKFVNAPNKPPLKLLLSYQGLSNYIESVTQQWRKLAPPILSTNHCEFNGACWCAHTRKIIPLAPIHLFTRQIVLYRQSAINCTAFPLAPYKLPPSINNILRARHFFLVCFFHFHRTLFRGFVGACMNPGSFSLFVHSLLCQITHLFLNGFSAKLVSALLPCMLYLSYYFQPEVNT